MLIARRYVLWALCLGISFLATAQTFRSSTYNVGPNPQKLIRADLNGDGFPDIVTANTDGNVTILLNNGDGTFRRLDAVAGQSGTNVTDVFAADLNNDGKQDLVVVDALSDGTANLNVLIGRGDGTFNAPSTVANHIGGIAAVAAQFSSDGNRDIAFGWNSVDPSNSSQRHANVTIYFGNGGGAFPTHTDIPNIGAQDDYTNGGAGFQIRQMNTGDFNGDGKTDFVIGECCGGVDVEVGAAYAYLNNGNGTFSARELYTAIPNEVRVADIDNNGRSDVLLPYSGCHTPCFGITALTNVANSPVGVDLPPPISGEIDGYYASAAVADFTVTGRRTIAYSVGASTAEQPEVAVIGFANQNSSGGYTLAGTYNTGTNVLRSLTDGDFNRDGKPDLAGILRPFDGTTLSQIAVLTNTTSPPACSATSNRTVKICAPTSGSTAASPVRVLAGLRSDAGIRAAQIYLDSSLVYQAPAGTKLIDRSLTIASGSHKITVKGWDASGAFSSAVTVNVSGSGNSTCTATANRTVNICLPTNGNPSSSPVRVLAGLRSDSGIQAAQVYLDGMLVYQGAAGTKTGDRSFSMGAGGHRITVKGWDKSGAFSSSVGITVR